MQTDLEVARALGKYRAPWFVFVPPAMLALIWAYDQVDRRLAPFLHWQDLLLLVMSVVLMAAAWWVPQTIVSTAGVRLVWRGRFIPWTDVDRVYQAGPGDPNVLVGLRGGKRLSLPGVNRDRLPGILILASRQRRFRGPLAG